VSTRASLQVNALLEEAGNAVVRSKLLKLQNSDGDCLHTVVYRASSEVVKTLLESAGTGRAELLKLTDGGGWSCLQTDVSLWSLEMVKVLLLVAYDACMLEELLKLQDHDGLSCLQTAHFVWLGRDHTGKHQDVLAHLNAMA
jgi:hypothetical protein